MAAGWATPSERGARAQRARARVVLTVGSLIALSLALIALAPACGVSAPVCCTGDAECARGARCFEGRCTPSCLDDAHCLSGEVCLPALGVCAAPSRPRSVCAYLFDDTRVAPAPVDAGPPSADGGTRAFACTPDALEPNDDEQQASLLREGSVEGLSICAVDRDFFSLPLAEGDTLEVEIVTLAGDADLDVALLLEGRRVAAAEGLEVIERLVYQAAVSGEYHLYVYAFAGLDGAAYSIRYQRIRAAPRCDADEWEPNDAPGMAPVLVPSIPIEATICEDDPLDLYEVRVSQQTGMRAVLRHPEAEALELWLLQEANLRLPAGTAEATDEGLVLAWQAAPEPAPRTWLQVRARSVEASVAPYTLELRPVVPSCTDAWEPNDSPNEAPLLAVPGDVEGVLCSGEVDFFRLEFSGAPAALAVEVDQPALRLNFLRADDFATLAVVDGASTGELPLANERSGNILLLVTGLGVESSPYRVRFLE